MDGNGLQRLDTAALLDGLLTLSDDLVFVGRNLEAAGDVGRLAESVRWLIDFIPGDTGRLACNAELRRGLADLRTALTAFSEYVCLGEPDALQLAPKDELRKWVVSLKGKVTPLVWQLAPDEPSTSKASTAAGQKKHRRRRQADRKTRPLTMKQSEAVQIVGECKGSYAEAGRRLGVHESTVREHYEAAMTKLGKSALPKHGTRPLGNSRRGQQEIAAGSDRRRG